MEGGGGIGMLDYSSVFSKVPQAISQHPLLLG